ANRARVVGGRPVAGAWRCLRPAAHGAIARALAAHAGAVAAHTRGGDPMNRRSARNLDLSAWPAFDDRALSNPRRKAFTARRKAVELYAADVPLTAIEADTGVRRGHLYRLLTQCEAIHEHGCVID